MCHTHYEWHRKRGLIKTRPADPIERFWSHVDRSRPSKCWPWTGGSISHGYGTLRHNGRGSNAHRVAYELTFGPIPPGLHIDHLCRNRICCNPAHLEAVTPGENLLRGFGASGLNARKTHCPAGHPYDEANTRTTPAGRNCRACDRGAYHRWQESAPKAPVLRDGNCRICGAVFSYEFTRSTRTLCSEECRRKSMVMAQQIYRRRRAGELI